jgi:hypothetical protein
MSSVNQAACVSGTTVYWFGYNSIPNIPITESPSDTNWRRWPMLHDGSAVRVSVDSKRTWRKTIFP